MDIVEIERLLENIELNDHAKIREALVTFVSNDNHNLEAHQSLEDLHVAVESYVTNVIGVVEKFKLSIPSLSKVVLETKSH